MGHRVDKYEIIETLGYGSYGKVKLCFDPQTGQQFAVKILQNPANNKNFQHLQNLDQTKIQNDFKKEFIIFQNFNHSNILKQIELKENAIYTDKRGQQYNCMIIVQEYLGGQRLFDYINISDKFPVNIAKSYFIQLLEGLKYLHKHQICHRDLKPENIMVDQNFVLKIIDFGYATNIQDILYSQLGSGVYRCPEIVNGQQYQGEDADIFASAVILFAMLTKNFPFESAENKDDNYNLLINQNFEEFWNIYLKYDQELQKIFNNSLKDLFQNMFALNPEQRLSIEQIFNSEWIKNGLPSYKEQQQQNQEFMQQQLQLQQQQNDLNDGQQQQSTNNHNEEEKSDGQNLFQGSGKFRSLEEMTEEFDDLNDEYENIDKERKLKATDKYNKNVTNIYSKRDPNLLLRIILKNSQKFTSEIELSDNTYDMKCTQLDENHETQEIFKINFTQQSQNTVCIQFKFVKGNYIQYLQKIKIIRDILKDYGKK